MKVYIAVKFKPYGKEEIVGVGKSEKSALAILKREFPYMRGTGNSMSSDKNNTYLLAIREIEVEG